MYIFLDKINSFIWSNGTVAIILMVGVMYTIKLKWIQFRIIPYLMNNPGCHKKNGGISQKKTVAMSLGTAMGTGNITGVASALAIGGAGSIFWMWVSAFTGMAVVYAENYLSSAYSSDYVKGPMAYISKGIGSRLLAAFFAVMCIGASFGMGGMVQINSMCDSVSSCIPSQPVITAVILFMIILSITSGGAKRIGSIAQFLLPFAAISYTLMCLFILFLNYHAIPAAFVNIFSSAFGLRQAAGGLSGFTVSKALTTGIRRGIFSNEAGLGSSPILHSAANSNDVELQGMWSMLEVFFDTIVVCSMTCLVILTSGIWTEKLDPAIMTATAFEQSMGTLGGILATIAVVLFTFTTACAQITFTEAQIVSLVGEKYRKIGRYGMVLLLLLGGTVGISALIPYIDFFTGLYTFFNMLGVYWCGSMIVSLTKEYFADPLRWETEKWPAWVKIEQASSSPAEKGSPSPHTIPII